MMDLRNIVADVIAEENLDRAVTVFRGNDAKSYDAVNPRIFLTFGDVDPHKLCANGYSSFDFSYNSSCNEIDQPTADFLPEDRGSGLLKKCVSIMEETGRRIEAKGIRLACVTNPKLQRILPRFGYEGIEFDSCGGASAYKEL